MQPFIDAGFDVINPVQCSAVGMDPERSKAAYGDELVFWGGGVDTQKTLPFCAPEEVCDQVRRRIVEIPGFGRIGPLDTLIEQISGVCGAGSRDNGRSTFEVRERKFLSSLRPI